MTKSVDKKIAFNGLTAKEWAVSSRSVWASKDLRSPREKYRKEHGATFPTTLAENAIRHYSKEGDLVLDPFSGVASTMLGCRNLNRNGVGYEIYEKNCRVSEDLLKQSTFTDAKQKIYNKDCRRLEEDVKPDTVQLTFTSPPYANFIQQSIIDREKVHKKSKLISENNSLVKQYGNDPNDFGNLEYGKFRDNVEKLMQKIYSVTKEGGYNIWVVKDHRIAKKKIPYVPVHSDIMNAGIKAGFTAHDLIVWDQNENRSLVVLGYPSVFYVNINHTFLVVLRKV